MFFIFYNSLFNLFSATCNINSTAISGSPIALFNDGDDDALPAARSLLPNGGSVTIKSKLSSSYNQSRTSLTNIFLTLFHSI